MSVRMAYMTGQYPRATDTFIQREVIAVRALGYHIETFSVRRAAASENVGSEQEAERRQTYYIVPASPITLIAAHLMLFLGSPVRYLKAICFAWELRPPGFIALFKQVAYFAEAGIVARRMHKRRLTHLHNHFANSSGSVAAIASELGGFTVSYSIHGPAEFFQPHYWQIGKKAAKALWVNCISHFCRSQVMAFTPMSAWHRLHVIHCGIDPSFFELPRRNTGYRLLFVGRLAAVKGLPVLLEALARVKRSIPQAELVVVGDGPDRASLENQVKQLNLQDCVRFLGYQSQARIRELLSQSDVFVMTSLAEGVPVVLMEAMAAGVPVIATRIAGTPELVEDGACGFLAPPGDPEMAAEKIVTLLNDPLLRQRFSYAGREVVMREFNVHTEARRIARIIESSMAGKSEPVRPEPIDQPEQTAAPTHGQSTSA